jgi:hypothetical protein
MSGQASVYVGRGTGWHERVNSRVSFKAHFNGAHYHVVGRVVRVSPTQAIIKVRVEDECPTGKPRVRIVDFPTDMIEADTVRVLREGEMTG